jgi:tRNA A37 methylthiotransferase MiaB
MVGHLHKAGMRVIPDAENARGQKLIVAGCMAQRFAKELRASMPEVDAFIGLDQLTQVAPIIEGLCPRSAGPDGRRPKISSRRSRSSFPTSTRPASA